MNNLLSICIQTFNRAQVLGGCLENLIPQVQKHSIPIYISDNASTDDTAEVVKIFQGRYPHIFYACNPQNLGPDANTACVLRLSGTRYSWLFGDKYRLVPGAIDMVLDKLKSADYDLLIVNTAHTFDRKNNRTTRKRVRDLAGSKVYHNANQLLAELGWHMTMVSSLICSRSLIEGGQFEKYDGTNFVQIGVIFSYLAGKDISVCWLDDPLVYGAQVAISWTSRTFEIFAKNWVGVIQSLPDFYPDSVKKKCILDHGEKAEVFTLAGFFRLKSQKAFNPGIFKEYQSYFPLISRVPPWLIRLIAVS